MDSKIIAIAAIFMMVAVCGAVCLTDESDAADSFSVEYQLDGAVIPVQPGEDGTVVLYGPEDVAGFYTPEEGKQFTAWKSPSGTIYQFGAKVTLSTDNTDQDTGKLVLTPYLTDVPQTVTLMVDGVSHTAQIEDGAIVMPEGLRTDKAGYTFDGWMGADGKVYPDIAKAPATPGAVYTAQYTEIYDVTWIVDGVTIAKGTTESTEKMNIPDEPDKEHYDFIAWKDADGVAYSETYVFDGDTVFTAAFEPVMLTVTFTAGETTVATVTVPYGQTVVMPALPEGYSAWDFDFSEPITADTTVEAVASEPEEPSDTYTVTFVVDGVTIATYASNAVTVPADPVKEGYAFSGWAIGDSVIANPATYKYTADTTLVALFTAVEVVEYDVAFVNGAETVATVQVVSGQTVPADMIPEAPEGMFWDYKADAPITADTTVYAQPEEVTVTFYVGEEQIPILTQTVPYGGQVDVSLLESYTFPAGYDSWDFDFTTALTSDVEIHAKEIVVPEEPGFFDSTTNTLAFAIIVLALIVLFAIIVYLRQEDRLPKQLQRLAKKPKVIEGEENDGGEQ